MDTGAFLHKNPYGDTCIIVAEPKLQSTRAGFLSSQSLFLAAAVFALNFEQVARAAFLVIAASAIIQGVIMNRAIHRRMIIVDYHKHYLYDYFTRDGLRGTPTAESFLDQNSYYRRAVRKRVNPQITAIPTVKKLYGYREFHNYRELRVWLEIVLPLFLVLMWALLIFLAFL